MALRKREKRPQVGYAYYRPGASVAIGSPEEFFIGSPEERLPLLAFGSTGRWVSYLQGKLGLPVTGFYDVGTQEAVRALQTRSGLAATGTTDLATWAVVASLAPNFGLNLVQPRYASYDPYAYGYAGYGPAYWGYPYYPFWFNNPPRGAGSSAPSGGGTRS